MPSMTTTFRFILTFLTFGLNFLDCSSQTFNNSDFKKHNIPKCDDKKWYAINNASDEFQVTNNEGKLQITKFKHTTEAKFEFQGGTLIGIDKGEWGGKLTFFPSDSKKDESLIKHGNIKFIFLFNNEIYFIEGIAHLSFSGGALYKLQKKDESFEYLKIVDFEESPDAYTIFENKIFICTSHNIYSVIDSKKDVLFHNECWDNFIANSIVIINGTTIYIGVRSGFEQLDLTTKKITFYKHRS